MKKFIKDWWPLLLIAGWWLWKKHEAKANPVNGLTPKGTDYGTSTSSTTYEWYYDENGKYHLNMYRREPDGTEISDLRAEGGETVARSDGRPDRYVKRWCNPPREFPYWLSPSRDVNQGLY